MENGDFYLGDLDRPTGKIRPGFVKTMRQLMERMRQSAEPVEISRTLRLPTILPG